jgi:site-specific recombinase XerC
MRAFNRYLTEAEQQQLLRHMHLRRADALARRDGALMRLFLHSGMRLAETLAMTVGDAMEALRTGWVFIPKEHRKGKRADHQVRVTEPLREALRDLLGARAEISGCEKGHESDPLVIGRNGAVMCARAVQKRFAMWASECGLPEGFSPHWMRHTRAKNIMRRSTSTDPRGIVQAALGHASISSSGIYTEVSKEELQTALEEVDGLGDRRAVKRGLRKAYERRVA